MTRQIISANLLWPSIAHKGPEFPGHLETEPRYNLGTCVLPTPEICITLISYSEEIFYPTKLGEL